MPLKSLPLRKAIQVGNRSCSITVALGTENGRYIASCAVGLWHYSPVPRGGSGSIEPPKNAYFMARVEDCMCWCVSMHL